MESWFPLGLVLVLLLGLTVFVAVLLLGIRFRLARPPMLPEVLALGTALDRLETRLRGEVDRVRSALGEESRQSRREQADSLQAAQVRMEQRLFTLTEALENRLGEMRSSLEASLCGLRDENATQLDKMRATVDEKLQGVLEKRLGESFRLVSERLEQVYRGLGEMQTLAAGVGDLKRVLTNVKARGTWGEVQLGMLLEQVFTPDQYASNVAVTGTREVVEYAVRLPGRGEDDGNPVWLPIDAKFPMEDYQRLLDAQEKADPQGVEESGRALENRIRNSAREIRQKYVQPPGTTDFAILFLPTEGLFAEVMRRPGLADSLQQELHVMAAGPTTLYAILNSLQMGFRTLAVQKRTGEIWNLLGAVKTEWLKYGEALSAVQKKLQEAAHKIDEVQAKSRAIGRKLAGVHELPSSDLPSTPRLPAEADKTLEAEA